MTSRTLSTLMAAVSIWLVGCTDTETDKRYEFREDKSGHLVRLDTRTGEAIAEGSRQLFPPKDTIAAILLSDPEKAKITGNGLCNESDQVFSGRVYNGSGSLLRTIGVSITNKKFLSEEVAWNRQYVIRDLNIRPFEVGTFTLLLTGVESARCDWTISYVYGSEWKPEPSWWDRLFQ